MAIYGAGSKLDKDELKNDFFKMKNSLLVGMKNMQKIYMKQCLN